MKILKKIVGVSCLIVLIMMISGCTQKPPGYPARYDRGTIDIELSYDPPIFYFGDVVQDNGSVNKTKTINWILTINNLGDRVEKICFQIVKFPNEFLMWYTTLALYQQTSYNLTHIDGSMTATFEIELEYDVNDEEFDRIWIKDIKSNTSTKLTFSITLDEAVAWSYNPNTSYVGYFEIRKHTIDPKCGNLAYEKLFVPFVVRT